MVILTISIYAVSHVIQALMNAGAMVMIIAIIIAVAILAILAILLRSLPYCCYGLHLEVSSLNYKQFLNETKMLESNHFTYLNPT